MKCSELPITLLFILLAQTFFGQNNYRFKNYTEREGLPNQSVLSCLEDSKGYMWLGTQDGITCYDGYHFKTKWNDKKLKGTSIYKIVEGNDLMWFQTGEIYNNKYSFNIEFLNQLTDSIGELRIPAYLRSSNGLKFTNVIADIKQINSDHLLYTACNKLFINNLKTSTLDSIEFKDVLNIDLGDTIAFRFIEDSEKPTLFFEKGIIEFNPDLKGSKFIEFNFTNEKEKLKNYTRHNSDTLLFISNLNNFYFYVESAQEYVYWFTDNSLYLDKLELNKMTYSKKRELFMVVDGTTLINYDLSKKRKVNLQDMVMILDPSKNYQQQPGIADIHYDGNNCFWAVSRDRGVFKLNYKHQKIKTFEITKKNYEELSILNVVQIDSSLLLSTNFGLLEYQIKNDSLFPFSFRVKNLPEPLLSRKDEMGSFYYDFKKRILWYGNNKFLVKYDIDKKTGEFINEIKYYCNDIVIQNNKTIWISDLGNGLLKKNIFSDSLHYFKYGESDYPDQTNFISALKLKDQFLFISTNTAGLVKLNTKTLKFSTIGSDYAGTTLGLDIVNDSIWVSTWSNGLLCFDANTGLLIDSIKKENGLPSNATSMIKIDVLGNLWATSSFGLIQFDKNSRKIKVFNKKHGLKKVDLLSSTSKISENQNGDFFMAYNNVIYSWNPLDFINDTTLPNVYFDNIYFNYKNSQEKIEILNNQYQKLKNNYALIYNQNNITFEFSAIHFSSERNIEYAYQLKGLENEWSYANERSIEYSRLAPGSYTFEVKAANSDGIWSKPISFSFNITPPFWTAWWFITFCIFLLILIIYFMFRIRTNQLRSRQIELEKIVERRTKELAKKHAESEKNRLLVEEKNKEINDSINYAERIQRSFLASEELLNANLNEYFVFFQPKEVVSGDFYWASKLNNGNFAIVNADSTGHGVPGAIISILNISAIEEAVKEGSTTPHEIFNKTRKFIIERLKKDGSSEGGKDGMDASIICFDFENSKFSYTAAQNPIWVIRNGKLTEIKPEKMPLGKHDKDKIPFVGGEFEIQQGDQIYTLTDGFQDQFGGPKGKKFMVKKMREYVLSISHLPMEEQHQNIKEVFSNWKGDIEQVDDVCMIGIKI